MSDLIQIKQTDLVLLLLPKLIRYFSEKDNLQGKLKLSLFQ